MIFGYRPNIVIWLILSVHLGLILWAITHVLLNKENSRSTFGWVGFILYAPIIGPIAYYLFGINRVRKRSKKLSEQAELERTGLKLLYPDYADRAQHLQDAKEHFDESEWGRLQIGKALTDLPLSPNNHVLPLHNGEEAYKWMLAHIRQAKFSVWLMTYIFDTDDKGKEFIDALVEAKDRGVDVRVIIDGVGELYGFPLAGTRLRRRGVRVARFLPPKILPPQVYMNLRNHRKLLVVDGVHGFSGGMNIGGRHMVEDPNNPTPTQDLHFLFHGPIVYDFAELFLDDWVYSNRHDRRDTESLPREEHVRFLRERRALKRRKTGPQSEDTGSVEVSFPRHIRRTYAVKVSGRGSTSVPTSKAQNGANIATETSAVALETPSEILAEGAFEVASQMSDNPEALRIKLHKKDPESISLALLEEEADAWCRLIKDGPDEPLNKIEALVSSMTSSARERVFLMSPYFLPTPSIESALINARLRGVKVQVVVPQKSNEPLVQAAMYRSVSELLAHGVEILMQPPPFAHSKLLLVDDAYVFVGSANMDPRSLRLNFELGVEIIDRALVKRLDEFYQDVVRESIPLTQEFLESRPYWRKLWDSTVWLFSPYL